MTPNDFSAILARIRSGMTTDQDEALVLRMVNALDFYATQTNYLPFDEAGNTLIELDENGYRVTPTGWGYFQKIASKPTPAPLPQATMQE